MKKAILTILTLALLLVLTACGEKEKVLNDPDITIDQISWSLEEENVYADRYLFCQFRNNSAYKVISLRMTFTGREDLTQQELDAFYNAMQTSQGFSDAFMENFRKDREEKGLSISLYAQADEELASGATADSVRCYYFGGFTSKNMIYTDWFVPERAEFTYEKGGKTYGIAYEFASEKYTVVTLQGD